MISALDSESSDLASLVAQMVNSLPTMQKTQVQFPGSGRCPRGGNGNPPQYLAWRILWTEETDGLQSIESQRAGHNSGHEGLTLSLSSEPKQEVRVEGCAWVCELAPWSLSRWSHYGNFSSLIYPLYEKEQFSTSLKLSDHLRPGVNGGQVEEGSWFSKEKWPRLLRE